MIAKLGYIIVFVSIIATNLSYGQQDSMLIQYRGDCSEGLIQSDSFLTEADISNLLFEKGYPYAQVDSVYDMENKVTTYLLECGPHFNYVHIHWTGQMAEELLAVQKRRKVISWREVLPQRENLLTGMVNKGYPYARLFTDPVAIRQDTLELEYSLDTIRRIYIQNVDLKGNFKMNQALFETMTGIGENQSFSLERIERSKQIIRQWDFADLKNLEYDFNPYRVNLIYHIEPSQPSRFDLLIGLVPSNHLNKKYEITGNAYLDIRNQLSMAERIYLKFDKYANSSQSIDLRFDFPYLPLIRSGILAEGLIDRRDSTVLDVHGRLGVQYRWRTNLKYAFFLQRDQSRLISIQSRRLSNTGKLPDELDYNYSAAGINLSFQTLDNTMNPRKGRVVHGTITAGLKKMVRNGQILAIELPSGQKSFQLQYDSLTQATVKSGLDISWDQYLPVALYSTIRLRAMAGWTWSTASLYQNELRRLGGFQDFRGFPEKSFLADAFSVWTVEYRFLFGAESNAFVFTDFGTLHQPGSTINWNFPYSVGIGLNLGTKAGVFGISYAVGGQRNEPLSLEQSRVNFGLMVNY